jgi:hypothetical protein
MIGKGRAFAPLNRVEIMSCCRIIGFTEEIALEAEPLQDRN